MGIETPKNQQLEHVKDKIRKKLRLWASIKLSLVGRVVVVNHILLATMWHSVACWMLDKETTLVKVAWCCLIKAKNQGGLGLVDPIHQSKVLLGKLLVRSLQPGPKLWKMCC